MVTSKTSAHFIVAQTAKDMAAAMFEEMMKDNGRYTAWKKLCPDLTPDKLQTRFIAQMWPLLIKQARATLAQMLATNISETLKAQITDALIKDASLKRGRVH